MFAASTMSGFQPFPSVARQAEILAERAHRIPEGALYRANDAGKDCVIQFASEVPGRT